MGDNIKENCGVAAVFIPDTSVHKGKAPQFLYNMLLNLQGRGQLGAGMTTYNPDRSNLLETYKGNGLVHEVFKQSNTEEQQKIFSKLEGNRGIGHTRYATSGSDDVCLTQPLERAHGRRWKWFSFCFNGNIANYADLKNVLMSKSDYHISYDSDSEIIMHYISRELQKPSRPNLAEVFTTLTKKFDGAYNIAFLNANGSILVYRDALGFKPMCYGYFEDVLLIASETNALINQSVTDIKYLNPGEMIVVDNGHAQIKQIAESKRQARCMFEWVYFSNVASIFDGKSVYVSRDNLGQELAKVETQKTNKEEWIVVPVPDSAKSAGNSFAYALNLPEKEGLIRNRFSGRTFIEGRGRDEKVRNKFTVQRAVTEGKKILLVDDSIVRGTTTKKIVKYLKEVGKAKEVHVRVSCPPIVAPCFYGIDMSTIGELFGAKFSIDASKPIPQETLDAMAKEIGADSLIYQSIPGLIKSIGMPKEQMCMACLDRNYPTKQGTQLYQVAVKNAQNGVNGRTYEAPNGNKAC